MGAKMLMTWIWDLGKIQLYLHCDCRKVSNCSRPQASGLYSGVNNKHFVINTKD